MQQDGPIAAQSYEDIFAASPETDDSLAHDLLHKIAGNRPAQVMTGNDGPHNHMAFHGRSEATHGGFDFGKLWHIDE